MLLTLTDVCASAGAGGSSAKDVSRAEEAQGQAGAAAERGNAVGRRGGGREEFTRCGHGSHPLKSETGPATRRRPLASGVGSRTRGCGAGIPASGTGAEMEGAQGGRRAGLRRRRRPHRAVPAPPRLSGARHAGAAAGGHGKGQERAAGERPGGGPHAAADRGRAQTPTAPETRRCRYRFCRKGSRPWRAAETQIIRRLRAIQYARRSALGARRSALGARRSALGARR